MSYFATVTARSLSHAALVFRLTACPHLSSNCVDQAIIISSECFTRNQCVHHFPTPFSRNWSPYFFQYISSMCSFRCLLLNGNPCAPVSIMYSMTTFHSSVISHALVSFACAWVGQLSAWCRIVVWTSSTFSPVFFQFSSKISHRWLENSTRKVPVSSSLALFYMLLLQQPPKHIWHSCIPQSSAHLIWDVGPC